MSAESTSEVSMQDSGEKVQGEKGEESDKSEDSAKTGCQILLGFLVVAVIVAVILALVCGPSGCTDQFAQDTDRAAQSLPGFADFQFHYNVLVEDHGDGIATHWSTFEITDQYGNKKTFNTTGTYDSGDCTSLVPVRIF